MEIKYDISIIVCCYRGEDTIGECLESLKYQRREFISIEVLLIDDGSKDKTAKVILDFLENNSFLRRIDFKYFRKKNEGLSVARNFGIKKSNSDIVAFIDEDAVADIKFSENIVKLFHDNQGVNCIGGSVQLLNSNDNFAALLQNSIFSFDMKDKNAVIGTNMAFRRDFIIMVGGFQPEFTYRGDESALFVRANDLLTILKSPNVIVEHPQPENLHKWLKTRYENGFFGAAVHDLSKLSIQKKLKRLMLAVITLSYPMIVLCLLVINTTLVLTVSAIILYILLLFKRFFYSKIISNYIREYNVNSKNRSSWKVNIYLCSIIIRGYFVEDYGYIRGYLKYNNFQWGKAIF